MSPKLKCLSFMCSLICFADLQTKCDQSMIEYKMIRRYSNGFPKRYPNRYAAEYPDRYLNRYPERYYYLNSNNGFEISVRNFGTNDKKMRAKAKKKKRNLKRTVKQEEPVEEMEFVHAVEDFAKAEEPVAEKKNENSINDFEKAEEPVPEHNTDDHFITELIEKQMDHTFGPSVDSSNSNNDYFGGTTVTTRAPKRGGGYGPLGIVGELLYLPGFRHKGNGTHVLKGKHVKKRHENNNKKKKNVKNRKQKKQ